MWQYNYDALLAPDELEHSGRKGMKWYQHIFTKKDGSLNYLGKRKAKKMKDDYTRLTGKQLRRNPTKSKGTKPVNEMTDAQIRKRIERIGLENELNSLQPAKVSKGKAIIQKLSKNLTDMAIERGTQIIGDYVEKNVRSKLGIDAKSTKSISQILADKAKDSENQWKIIEYQRKIDNAKAKTRSEADSKHQSDNNNQQQSNSRKEEHSNKNKTNRTTSKHTNSDDILRGTVDDIPSGTCETGRQYIAYLLEDKHR